MSPSAAHFAFRNKCATSHVVNTLASYSGSHRFDFWPEGRLSRYVMWLSWIQSGQW